LPGQRQNAFPEDLVLGVHDILVGIVAGVFEHHDGLLWRLQAVVVAPGHIGRGQQVVCAFDEKHGDHEIDGRMKRSVILKGIGRMDGEGEQ
jgi:hypothetical protein